MVTSATVMKSEKVAHPYAKKRRTLFVTLALLLVVSGIGSLMIGPVSFTLSEVWQSLVTEGDTLAHRIVWELRLPRMLIGAIVGMSLAVAGAILQGVMQNPLADPGIIGVTSGARCDGDHDHFSSVHRFFTTRSLFRSTRYSASHLRHVMEKRNVTGSNHFSRCRDQCDFRSIFKCVNATV